MREIIINILAYAMIYGAIQINRCGKCKTTIFSSDWWIQCILISVGTIILKELTINL